MSRHLIIEADGGSRGNPGPSGSGAVVIDAKTGEVLAEISKFIGTATNNVAEYNALIEGLREAYAIDEQAHISVRMDSKLVVEQMSGGWKIKHPAMRDLAIIAHEVIANRPVQWQWIPREENSRADALANKAMDEQADDVVIPGHKVTSVATEFNFDKPSSVRSPVVVDEPATTFYLVRHGRTQLTESRKISGGNGEDPELSEAGIQDAKSVANEVSRIGRTGPFAHLATPVVVVSSPMKRARQTAELIAREIGADVEVVEELREISFGDWDGHTHEEVRTTWFEEFKNWQGSWDIAPPNGESLKDFDQRISKAKQAILERHSGAAVVVVAHVMPIRGFVSQALETGVSAYWRTQISPCSLTGLRLWGSQEAELQFLNYTQHLA